MSFPATLALEDGTLFRGIGVGARATCGGEVVFHTGLTGYQEIFTDPSYTGQIVVLTYPHIGNYGTTPDDDESDGPAIEGLIVREMSKLASNWRSLEETDDLLQSKGVPVLTEIDTRALVRHIRQHGALRGVISSTETDAEKLVEQARALPKMAGQDLATQVSVTEAYEWTQPVEAAAPTDLVPEVQPERFHVVAYDFGIKRNILRSLATRGCRVTVVPAGTSADDVLGLKPDGLFLSNGPGDPEPLEAQVAQVQALAAKLPVFGICLGHQVLGLALGAKTFKLKFGHHGANHPVRNEKTGRVEITSQNHGFAVDPDSLPADVEITHINLNDQTVEGFRSKKDPLFSVQYHPEAAPGPHDSAYLFDEFVQLMEK